MPKIIVSLDGVIVKEVQLTKARTSLGRRPYNDIVIDNLAVSGEHAAIQLVGHEIYVEDLNSTNGTYINGKAIKKQLLQATDSIEIGKYKIKCINDGPAADFEQTMAMGMRGVVEPASSMAPIEAVSEDFHEAPSAVIKVTSGAAAGREVALTKIVTTIGKPGVAVAAITKSQNGYVMAHVEGANKPTLNGELIGLEPVTLTDGDVLELAGIQMQFVLRS